MPINIFGGGKEIRCDGHRLDGQPCNAVYGSYGINETQEEFLEGAFRRGYTYNSKNKRIFCPICSQAKQQ